MLHVRPGDPGVMGAGEWARLAKGLLVSRTPDESGRMMCDLCRHRLNNTPAPPAGQAERIAPRQ